MKKLSTARKIQFKFVLILVVGLVILTTLLYFLIPSILNYPEYTYGTNFQVELENTSYIVQTILIALAIFVIFACTIFSRTRFLVKYNDVLDNPNDYKESEINILKANLFNAPYSILIQTIIIPSIALTVIHAFTIHQLGITTLKLFMLVVSCITVYVTTVFMYINNIFKKILSNLPVTDLSKIKRTSITSRIMFNTFPIFAASLIFITLLGYVKVGIEKGNSSFEAYKRSLEYYCEYNKENFSTLDDFINNSLSNFKLLNENDIFFIRLPDGTFINRNYEPIEFSDFFVKYLNELSDSNEGRVYEYYGIDCQSATYKMTLNDSEYTVGVYFKILSSDVLFYFLFAYIILLAIDMIAIFIFSNSFKYDITVISNKFNSMSSNINSDESKQLSTTSNDEIGDICNAYNQIQELTIDNQTRLIEKERLASLGQMIGGIAHNLKTPIFSISGGLEGLNDLIEEFDSSIEDPNVNDKDMHDIANDMRNWIEKLKTHTAYMSDVITAVKGQAVTLSEENIVDFTVEELFKQVDILMKHEVKNALVTLNLDNQVGNDKVIKGNINSLVQIVNNIISNAIEAYNGATDKSIDVCATADSNNISISITDYGPGIADDVKEKLFKEMITTKGKNGTGLGLFMSYSTIKAHFHGDMSLESEINKGTKFTILLPY